jgi:hypothetical protein
LGAMKAVPVIAPEDLWNSARASYRYADTDTDRLRHDKFFVFFAEVSSEATMMDDDIPTTGSSISDQADEL